MDPFITNFDSRQTMITADCEAFHYREPYGKTLDFHSHDFYELYVFVDGNVTYYIEEKMYVLIGGDMMLIPPGRMHRPVITDSDSVYERIVLWVHPSYLERLDEDKILQDGLTRYESMKNYLVHPSKEDFDPLHSLLSMLLGENKNPSFGKKLMTQSLVSMLMIHFIRHALHRVDLTPQPEQEGIVPDMIRYINAHLEEELCLDHLADRFYVSKYHLLKEFKRYTNSTIYDYIISKRIITAKRLIHRGYSVTESCRLCGFADYSNFYKSFVKKTGFTPKQFKLLSKA